jgi:hypothetical protein
MFCPELPWGKNLDYKPESENSELYTFVGPGGIYTITGISPYVALTRDSWFDPGQYPGPEFINK